WVKMEKDDEPVTIPVDGSGLVRLIWDGKKEKMGDDRMAVQLWSQPSTGKPVAREYYRVEFPITFVSALRLTMSDAGHITDAVHIQEIATREEKTKEF